MEPGKQSNSRPQPGVWKGKITGALYELRYSSLGTIVLVHRDGAIANWSAEAYELVEPGATLASPLFRPSPAQGTTDKLTLLRLTEAALRGLATNAYNDVGDGEELGITAARAARAALIALEAPPVLAPEGPAR